MFDWCTKCTSARMCVMGKAARDDDEEPPTPTTPKFQDEEEPQSEMSAWCTKVVTRARASTLFGGNPVDVGREKKMMERAPGGKRKKIQSNAMRERELALDLPPITRDYKVLDRQSGQGILRQAIHIESKQRRAVLTLAKRNVPAGITKEDIEKQLELLLKVDHLNVLTFYEACIDAKNSQIFYLIYEWPEGGLLLDHLTRYHEDINESHFSGIFREIVAAIGAANHFNVHHLDWSLICFFLGRINSFSPIKIFGFGLAGVLLPLVTGHDRKSKSNKHYYVAPEVLTENVKTMSHLKLHLCDVWSIGTLLYMLMCGRPPFYGTRNEVFELVKKGSWMFGHEFDLITKEAKGLIEMMLVRNIKFRKSASELLKHPWLQLHHQHHNRHNLHGALQELQRFATETHCKQTLARLLADLGLQGSQYSELEEQFKMLDLDGNGVIEVSELAAVASQLPGVDADSLEQILASCDRNGNLTVDISEFISAVVLTLEQKDERLLVKAFEKMDMNNDARITKGELFRILTQYSGTLEAAEISSFVDSIDTDKDKKIDYHEFKRLFNTREKDTEHAARLHAMKTDAKEKNKALRDLGESVKDLFFNLKVSAGQLVPELQKLQKQGNNEDEIKERVQELLQILKDFMGKPPQILADLGATGLNEKEDVRNNITGLAVFDLHKRTKADKEHKQRMQEEADRHAAAQEADAHHRSSVQANPTGAPGAATAQGAAANVAQQQLQQQQQQQQLQQQQKQQQQQQQHQHHEKTVGELYVGRALHIRKGAHKFLRKEISKRRRWLWMGGGDGAKNAVNIVGAPRGADVDMIAMRGTTARKTMGQGELSARGGESSERGGELSARMGPRESVASESEATSSRGSTTEESQSEVSGGSGDGNDDSEDENAAQGKLEAFITAWTKKKGNMRRSKDAMKFAAQGPAMVKINQLPAATQQENINYFRTSLFSEYRMSEDLTEELTDLKKLAMYKCMRRWIPVISVWLQQLAASRNEMVVNIYERRATHRTCILHMCQLVEQIMFSLNELLYWQSEGLSAISCFEESCLVPPPSRRFLPFRDGEIDENARTPRDVNDAEELAPDRVDHRVEEPEFLSHATAGSFGASENFQSSEFAVTQNASDAYRSSHADELVDAKQRRLDRNYVRSRHEKKNAAEIKKIHDLAVAAHSKASQSIMGSIA